jgi:hypothetical protein
MTQQGRNMYKVFTNKDCMYFGALVGEYYFISEANMNCMNALRARERKLFLN